MELIYIIKEDSLGFFVGIILTLLLLSILLVFYYKKRLEKKLFYRVVIYFAVFISFAGLYLDTREFINIHEALNDESKLKYIEGKIENYKYVNGKGLTTFTVNNMQFIGERLYKGYNPNTKISFNSLHKYYNLSQNNVNFKIKIAYIVIGHTTKIIKIWHIKDNPLF